MPTGRQTDTQTERHTGTRVAILHYLTVYGVITQAGYDTRCYFNVRSKADMSQLNIHHRTSNYKLEKQKKLTG